MFLLLRTFWAWCAREYGRASAARDEVQLPRTSHTQTRCTVVSTNTPQTHKHRGVWEHGNHQGESSSPHGRGGNVRARL